MIDAGLRDRLQAALGGAYKLDRELGGGGMSRVFVAYETALGRTVALKVLSPELAAGISIERFHREIQVAVDREFYERISWRCSGRTRRNSGKSLSVVKIAKSLLSATAHITKSVLDP